MKQILNFGSLNIDKRFCVEHIVRPGETLASKSLDIFPGGKGLNQSVALARAGGEVYHAGKVGQDGQFLLDTLAQAGVDTRYVEQTGGQSGQAIIQVDHAGQNCILLFPGTNFEITEAEIDQVLQNFERGDLIVLQNEINLLQMIMVKAGERGLEIALNPSPIGPELARCDLSSVCWFLLNEVEGFELTGENEPEKITQKLLEDYPSARIVLTLGKDGVLYQDKNACFRHGIYKVPVVDTTAAGDTFTGFFLCRVMAGDTIPRALQVASVASSIAVSHKGAAVSIPTLTEVLNSPLLKAGAEGL